MINYSTTHQNTQQAKKFVGNLTGKHYNYLRFNRKMPRNWVVANFESITQKEAKEMGFSAPSDGILLKSALPSLQNQVRPNDPKVEKRAGGTERVIKYITPFGCEIDAMLPVHPDYPNFWTDVEELKKRCWIIDGHPYLFVTEGFIDALIATANGFPTIALTGVENGLTGSRRDPEGKRFLVPTLRHFAELGFGFIIGFDADSVSNENVINAQKTLVKRLQLFKDSQIYNMTGLWTMTSDGSDKGIGDYIQKHGADAFRQNVLRRAEPIANWLIKVNEQLKAEGINADDELPPKTTKLEAQYTQVKLVVGDKIKFNELTKEIEFNGKPASYDDFKLELALQFKLELKNCSEKDFKAIIVKIAKDNSYHPVRDYLEECHQKYSDTSIFNGLAKRFFGGNNPLHELFLRKWLISLVARVFKPGCKVDTALILKGEQGLGKSTFFKILASDAWFCDDMGSVSDKDQLLKFHQSWVVEWGELEKAFTKSDVSDTKAFLTTTTDKIRLPYGAKTESFPRMTVICGTTNRDDVFRDSTGSRRFWTVNVIKQIHFEEVQQLRDEILGAAVELYKSGEPWYLTRDEQKSSDENNKAFSTISPWFDDIENYLEDKDIVTTDSLLDILRVNWDNHSDVKKKQLEIAEIMITLKWVKCEGIKDSEGRRRRGYKRPVVVTTPEPEPTPEDVTQTPTGCVDDCVSQNPDIEGDTQPTQPTQQNSQNSKPVETKPDDFQIGDRVIEVLPKTIGGIKRFGTVVEVEKPNGCKGIYTVEWENANVTGLRNDMYSHEIEHYDG